MKFSIFNSIWISILFDAYTSSIISFVNGNSMKSILFRRKSVGILLSSLKLGIFNGFRLNAENKNNAINTSVMVSSSNTSRPEIILNKILKGEDIFYFGVGSNMLRSKVENRGAMFINQTSPTTTGNNKTSIVLKSFVPAIARDYRLGL